MPPKAPTEFAFAADIMGRIDATWTPLRVIGVRGHITQAQAIQRWRQGITGVEMRTGGSAAARHEAARQIDNLVARGLATAKKIPGVMFPLVDLSDEAQAHIRSATRSPYHTGPLLALAALEQIADGQTFHHGCGNPLAEPGCRWYRDSSAAARMAKSFEGMTGHRRIGYADELVGELSRLGLAAWGLDHSNRCWWSLTAAGRQWLADGQPDLDPGYDGSVPYDEQLDRIRRKAMTTESNDLLHREPLEPRDISTMGAHPVGVSDGTVDELANDKWFYSTTASTPAPAAKKKKR